MKKKITFAIATLVAAFGFAQEAPVAIQYNPSNALPSDNKPLTVTIGEKVTPKKSFTYLRMGITDTHPSHGPQAIPGLGLGYRLTADQTAIDISASYTGEYGTIRDAANSHHYATFPKLNYLRYAKADENTSMYFGGGMAWGSVRAKNGDQFLGLIPNVALGVEMNRLANWRSFLQFDVSQPAIAAARSGAFPGPVAELSFGAGF